MDVILFLTCTKFYCKKATTKAFDLFVWFLKSQYFSLLASVAVPEPYQNIQIFGFCSTGAGAASIFLLGAGAT
jgi:hypothetical protein